MYRDTILATTGLVSYWELEETSGSLVKDSFSNNSGTYVNSPTLGVSGFTQGNAVTFNGSNQFVTIPINNSLGFTNDFSIEAWIKTTSSSAGVILSSYQVGGTASGYGLELTTAGIPVFNCAGSNVQLYAAHLVNDGKWHYIVGTQSGTLSSIYVDGNISNSGTRSPIPRNSFPLCFARDSTSTRFFNGTLDNIAVYNRSLTATEISNNNSIIGSGIINEQITQLPIRSLVLPTDANLRLTQNAVRSLVLPQDANLRLTQGAIRSLVSPTDANLRLSQSVVRVLRGSASTSVAANPVSFSLRFEESADLNILGIGDRSRSFTLEESADFIVNPNLNYSPGINFTESADFTLPTSKGISQSLLSFVESTDFTIRGVNSKSLDTNLFFIESVDFTLNQVKQIARQNIFFTESADFLFSPTKSFPFTTAFEESADFTLRTNAYLGGILSFEESANFVINYSTAGHISLNTSFVESADLLLAGIRRTQLPSIKFVESADLSFTNFARSTPFTSISFIESADLSLSIVRGTTSAFVIIFGESADLDTNFQHLLFSPTIFSESADFTLISVGHQNAVSLTFDESADFTFSSQVPTRLIFTTSQFDFEGNSDFVVNNQNGYNIPIYFNADGNLILNLNSVTIDGVMGEVLIILRVPG